MEVEELRALAARALVKATHGGTSAALRAAGYPEDVCEQVAGQEQCIHFSPAANCSSCALFGRTLTCFSGSLLELIPPYRAPSPVPAPAREQNDPLDELCADVPTRPCEQYESVDEHGDPFEFLLPILLEMHTEALAVQKSIRAFDRDPRRSREIHLHACALK